tara:strand:+ start:65 stop:310 length:246 start_codon:yes stop_codon:yes gene_type:complete
MQFLVTAIDFDFEDSTVTMTAEDKQEVIDNSIGMWDADDEDDLMDEITTACGWCIKSIDYHDMAVVTLSANLQKLKTQTPD